MDRNIDFANEAYLPEVGFPNPPQVSDVTQRVTNKFSPGSPLLWIPGFLLGQLLSLAFNVITPLRLDGYGFLTQYITALWAMFFSVAGYVVIFAVLRKQFSESIAWKSLVFLFLATQMFYYTAVDPLNSHSASFFFSSLLLWSSYHYLQGKRSLQWVILLGVLGGVLTLIRNQDAVVLVPIGVMLLLTRGKALERLTRGVLYVLSWFSIVVIQGLMTFYLYGQFNSPYLIQGEKIHWFQPDFWRVFFTQQNGLFFFAPGLLICVAGLYIGTKKGDLLSRMGLLTFILGAYGVAAWNPEIIGGPYGTRMFISTLPWLMIGFANFLEIPRVKKISLWLFISILGILAANTVLQTVYMLARF